MASLNKVLLMGNLTRDPELRYAPNGSAVTTFTIAVSRTYNTSSGEKKEDVSFIRIVCWGKLAQRCSEYLFKGRPVFVEGRLQSRSWQTQDGSKRNTIEVIAQNVQFLGKGRTAEISNLSGGENAGDDFGRTQNEPVEVSSLDDLAVQSKDDEEVPF